MNIYIGNFSYDITQDDLKEVFAGFGYVENVKIIRDQYTGDSKGFGFVEMPNKPEAEAALLSIAEVKGRKITISEARPQTQNNFSYSKKNSSNRKERRY